MFQRGEYPPAHEEKNLKGYFDIENRRRNIDQTEPSEAGLSIASGIMYPRLKIEVGVHEESELSKMVE